MRDETTWRQHSWRPGCLSVLEQFTVILIFSFSRVSSCHGNIQQTYRVWLSLFLSYYMLGNKLCKLCKFVMWNTGHRWILYNNCHKTLSLSKFPTSFPPFALRSFLSLIPILIIWNKLSKQIGNNIKHLVDTRITISIPRGGGGITQYILVYV